MKKTIIYLLLGCTIFFSSFAIAKENKSHGFSEAIETFIHPHEGKGEGYTINFKSVPMVEYIRFISKVSNVNFLYSEEDLQFNVTVVSEEKISSKYLLSTLIQILRTHGLMLLEENNNYVIHKSEDVKELAQVVTNDKEEENAIVTRIFQIRNIPLTSVTTILQSMISKSASIEPIVETRQLIITDITTNIHKIKQLIDAVDASDLPLKIEHYITKYTSPKSLIDLVTKIMQPLIANNPFILVPQELNNTIYFVTTDLLSKQVLDIFHRLDIPPSKDTKKALTEENIFLYQSKFKSPKELEAYLKEISVNLKKVGFAETNLIDTIDSMSINDYTKSILFVGNQNTLAKLKEILTSIDIHETGPAFGDGAAQFLSYQPQFLDGKRILASLDEMAQNLDHAKLTNPHLLAAIKSGKWIPSTCTLLFTGDPIALNEIKSYLTSLDTAKQKEAISSCSSYFLYKLQYTPGDVIEDDIEKFVDNLKAKKTNNPELIHLLENIKLIKETNSLLLTGDQDSIDQAKKIIAQFDEARANEGALTVDDFYVFKPTKISAKALQDKLQDIANNLEKSHLADPAFIRTLRNMKYTASSQSIVFTGNKTSLEKLKTLLPTIDTPAMGEMKTDGEKTYLIYNVQHSSAQRVLNSLKAITQDLIKEKTADKNFVAALQSAKYDASANILIFTGTPEALEKIQPILEKFDITPSSPQKASAADQFFIYKPKYYSGPSLENILREFVTHLSSTGFANNDLFHTIETMQYVEKTNSLLFAGDEKTIQEIKTLLTNFDVPGKDGMPVGTDAIQPIDNTSFLVYKLQYHKGDEIQAALKKIAQEITAATPQGMQKSILTAINSIQWIQVTNSLLCTGDQETMTRLQELIKNLDVPLKQVFIEMLVLETSLSNLLNFGLQWGSKATIKKYFGGSVSNFPSNTSFTDKSQFPSLFNQVDQNNTPTGQDIPFQQGFDFGVIGDILMHKGKSFISLGSLLNALQTDNESTIVMTPKILAQDGKTASIFIGSNIPYVGSTNQNLYNGTQGANITQNLEYRDVGMNLTLTPVMGNADIVTLTINLDNTATVIDPTTGEISTSGSVQGITTTKTTMATTVHIPNKHFLILSGMVTDNKQKTKEGIPCLGGLPLVGHMFSKSTTNNNKDNLVIFIRPHIINSFKDMASLSDVQEDFFRENTGSASLEKNFEESIELLKIPEDD